MYICIYMYIYILDAIDPAIPGNIYNIVFDFNIYLTFLS